MVTNVIAKKGLCKLWATCFISLSNICSAYYGFGIFNTNMPIGICIKNTALHLRLCPDFFGKPCTAVLLAAFIVAYVCNANDIKELHLKLSALLLINFGM